MSRVRLMGLGEVAARCGVRASAVSMWRSRYHDFPEPDSVLLCGPVWLESTIERWLASHPERVRVRPPE